MAEKLFVLNLLLKFIVLNVVFLGPSFVLLTITTLAAVTVQNPNSPVFLSLWAVRN